MEIIQNPSQYFFLAILIPLLIFYSLIVYAERRAVSQTGLPIPKAWKHIMAFCLYLILFSILFVVFT